jgi:alcohol dehydrogenase (cytochrome c)
MGYNGTATLAGGGLGWGDFAVDTKEGLVFVGTTEPAPNENATYRPGPNLFSDSIIALNITSGKMLWYYQTTPHDLYNFDCGWNVVLGTVSINGSEEGAVFKACKNGYLYALNEMTGKLIWYFDPSAVARINTGNANYVVTGKYNATQPWSTYPSNQTFVQCPGIDGGIEADIASAYGKIYIASYNFCVEGQITSVSQPAPGDWGITDVQYLSEQANTTIYAVDANTGRQVWSYTIPHVPFRGWLTVSNGMVFAGSVDGNIYVLGADSGNVITKIYLGTSLYTTPTIGADSSGSMMLFELIGSPSYGDFQEAVPGSLLAFGLPSTYSTYSSSVYYYIASGALAISLAFLTITAVQRFVLNRKKYQN